MEDSKIIELYLARDESALRETERKYGSELKSISLRITGSREDANECFNDTMLKAWESVHEVSPNNLRAYLMKIYGLTEAILLDEPNEEKKLWFEKGSRIDCISYSFTVDGDGIPAIPTQTLAVEHEFEVDGYKFVIDKMVASPMGIDITITDRLHQDIDMDGMHFNAINLLCHYSFSKEFDAINNPYSFEERMEFQKFLEEHDLVEGIYEIAVELDDEAKKYWHGGNRTWNYIKDENGDCNSIIMHILFKGPVYEDEILAVGFTKRYFDQMHLESYGHNLDVEIWRKND